MFDIIISGFIGTVIGFTVCLVVCALLNANGKDDENK